MAAEQNILLVRLKSIGDILFTLPACHRVRAAFPQAKISFLVSKEYALLLEGFRCVDTVLALDRAQFRRVNPKAVLGETFSLLRALRQPKFALAVDLQGYGETALLTWWSGAPQRWGAVNRPGRKWAYTRAAWRDTNRHPAENFLSVLQAGGLGPAPICNQFSLPDNAAAGARQLFGGWGLDPAKRTLFIQPFTSSPEKDWPLERYLAVAGTWRQGGGQVVFGGGPAEQAALEPVRQAGFPTSAGASLLVTAGLMQLSTLILGADTGLLHLAVAMGKRAVMIMASAHPGSSHPFQHRDWTVTPAEGQPVTALPASAVEAACRQALAELAVS
jgi:ADP-heptose:LPS heptosyltransferase